jgi:HSP20 family protein
MVFKSLIPFASESGRDPFTSLQREMNKLFDDMMKGSPLAAAGVEAALSPRLDVKENDKAYLLSVELPGVAEEDMELEVANRVLTIRGEKKVEKEEKGDKGYHVMERSYGSFMRSLTLPDDVDEQKIDASFDKGVLTVTLPKSKEAAKKTKKIAVKAKK